MVVEADGHAAVRLALDKRFVDVLDQFGMLVVHDRANDGRNASERNPVLVVVPLERFFSG